MPEITWVRIKDQLPPVNERVLTLHVTTEQTLGEIEVLYLDKSGSFYPGGLSVGWISHWAHLPQLPKKPEIVNIKR